MWRDTAPGIRAGENPANMAGMASAGSIPAPAGCSIGHPPFSAERARPHQPMAWRRTPLPGSRVPGGWKNGTAPGWGCSGSVSGRTPGQESKGSEPSCPNLQLPERAVRPIAARFGAELRRQSRRRADAIRPYGGGALILIREENQNGSRRTTEGAALPAVRRAL